MKIVFFGTPKIAADVLSQLVDAGIDIVGIVTKPDVAKGRSLKLLPSSVKDEARKLLPNIPIFDPIKCSQDETVQVLKQLGADLFVVVAYGEIISQAVLDVPPCGAINMHASYLPKYRGAAPMQRALLNGDKETGVSIIQMVRKMDAGDILCAEKIHIGLNMTLGELEKVMADVGAKALLKTIQAIEINRLQPIVQDESQVSFAKKIESHEAEISWTKSAYDIHNQIRALSPHPGAYCFVTCRGQRKRMKIYRTQCVDMDAAAIYGPKEHLIVQCQDGALVLDEIQIEGKPVMKAKDFLKGTPSEEISFQ